MGASRKGSRNERNLTNALDERGFEVIRSPASGSGTDRDQPDILAGNGDDFYLIEAKYSTGEYVYVDASEIEALERFAAGFGGTPLLETTWSQRHGDPTYGTDREPFYFFHTDDVYRTDDGNYRVKRETAFTDGHTIDEL